MSLRRLIINRSGRHNNRNAHWADSLTRVSPAIASDVDDDPAHRSPSFPPCCQGLSANFGVEHCADCRAMDPPLQRGRLGLAARSISTGSSR